MPSQKNSCAHARFLELWAKVTNGDDTIDENAERHLEIVRMHVGHCELPGFFPLGENIHQVRVLLKVGVHPIDNARFFQLLEILERAIMNL